MFRFALLVVAAVVLAGCTFPPGQIITGSGKDITVTFEFTDFTRVEVGSAFQLELVQGTDTSVELTIDENIEPHLDVKQSGDTVKIALKPMLSLTRATMKARIVMPELKALDASGATRVTLEGFSSDRPLDITVSGASTVRGDISAGDAEFEVSGASTLELEGAAQELDAVVSGASTARLESFPVQNARAEASGASRIELDVSGKLDATASGASTIVYMGDPETVHEEESGASTIRAK